MHFKVKLEFVSSPKESKYSMSLPPTGQVGYGSDPDSKLTLNQRGNMT